MAKYRAFCYHTNKVQKSLKREELHKFVVHQFLPGNQLYMNAQNPQSKNSFLFGFERPTEKPCHVTKSSKKQSVILNKKSTRSI